jgi:hypothetical protein
VFKTIEKNPLFCTSETEGSLGIDTKGYPFREKGAEHDKSKSAFYGGHGVYHLFIKERLE